MDIQIHFSENGSLENNCYKLMELPPDLVSVIQSRDTHHWSIRGRTDDDAVLCLDDKTYSIKSVVLSNAICVLRASEDSRTGDAIAAESVHEILELIPSIPRLHRLYSLLRGQEYDGSSDLEGEVLETDRRYTYDYIRSQVQASDKELQRSLRNKHILNMDGSLRPISTSYLSTILELVLNVLVALSLRPNAVPVVNLTETLGHDHEIPRGVMIQIMSWFGDLTDANQPGALWKADVMRVLTQIGLGILSSMKGSRIKEAEFLQRWRHAAGESFESKVDIALLAGNYLTTVSQSMRFIAYFPSSELPTGHAERFAELFLVQERWKAADMTPFLEDVTSDEKERDKLLMKYARVTTGADGVAWYTARGGTMA